MRTVRAASSGVELDVYSAKLAGTNALLSKAGWNKRSLLFFLQEQLCAQHVLNHCFW